MTVLPLKDSKDPNAPIALARLNQIKSQLNLTPSSMSRQAPKDMAAERAAADFDITALSHFWVGGDKKYQLMQQAYDIIKNDPELVLQSPKNFLEMNREDMREFTMGQIYRVVQIVLSGKYEKELAYEIARTTNIYNESFSMRFFVHDSLFKNVVNMLGNKEQQDRYNDDIDNFRIFGCFAMTELGHSSALRDLETVATYDADADEFILESPTITSTKWYIGAAAQTATHTVVISQTVINGKNVGLNWFVVQLREKASGKVMPGVVLGDIGSKAGHQGVDNGWIQFRKLRIPRSDMLAKWVSLDRDGTYHPAPNPAVMYATLIPERLSLLTVTTQLISQALTIATRYGVVRRQGPKNQQIMDYQSHYVKLIPAIAFMYMMQSASIDIDKNFNILTSGGKIDDPIVYLNHMGEMHAVSASIKGLSGWYASDILETCRRCCGGHAYSTYNAIAYITNEWGVMTTGGGDNVVLLQQAARLLLYRLQQKLEFDDYPELKFKSSSHYIADAIRLLALEQWNVTDINLCRRDPSLVEEALNAILVKRLNSINESLKNGANHNDLLLESVRVAELHCATYIFSVNVAKFGLPQAPAHIEKSVYNIMQRLTILWGLHTLHTYSDQGFKEGFLTPQHIKDVEKLYLDINKSLRSQVIGLTDAWGFPDFVLKAPIAKYDGDIYETYFETLLTAPNSTGIPPYQDKYVKPLTERVAKK
ncbi:acyl-CoA dehydrogenase/oxidase [Halteromyces radiatus]|uniref:acyl-CoA dehydrogenase/oxidase n=1 Tax=Halteromyces radiatus TaxID=101107 RepID=UPI002221237A|nr:acyl-CoA dehydrogenase/oxidase [Halteromyces radiatus]KAI8086146.1 acyl-CoA dehydrogenase/oxidase [Halteromyces radiatus]